MLSIHPEEAEGLLRRLHEEGVKKATIIGEVIREPKGVVVVE